MRMRLIRAFFLTLFLFGLLGWIYIALNAETHMQTLSLPLTHLLPWPREDTFGTFSFLISMVSFFCWNIVKKEDD
jgi:TRAP-type C4-dicarboxylate transport system permease small subunit